MSTSEHAVKSLLNSSSLEEKDESGFGQICFGYGRRQAFVSWSILGSFMGG